MYLSVWPPSVKLPGWSPSYWALSFHHLCASHPASHGLPWGPWEQPHSPWFSSAFLPGGHGRQLTKGLEIRIFLLNTFPVPSAGSGCEERRGLVRFVIILFSFLKLTACSLYRLCIQNQKDQKINIQDPLKALRANLLDWWSQLGERWKPSSASSHIWRGET